MATIRDVASKASVSLSTVSRVFNDYQGVSPGTRQRVVDVASSLNYRPHAGARNLRLGRLGGHSDRTHAVGFLTFRNTMLGGDAFSRELMCAVEAALCERGLGIRVIPAVPEGDLPFEIQDGRVDGVIGRFFGPVYGQIAKRVPAVNIDAHDEAADAYSLVPDYALGVYEATARLLRTGHKRIALLTEAPVSGDRGFWSVLAHGCLCALAEAGVSEPPIYCGRASLPAQGYAVGQRVFQGADPRPHAILGPDSALLGVYRAAAECGVRIPDDVSLIGVNNLPYGEFLHPPLTTIDVKVADMAREGTNILSECIKTGRKRKGLELTPVELVVRASARV